MVLDPLSALGLAGNIVQFVDFSCKLISEAQEIYHSERGKSAKAQTLSTLAQDLKKLNDGLEVSMARGTSAAGPLIRTLAFDCQKVADDILVDIQKLESQCKPHQKWASFRAALRETFGDNSVRHLSSRIKELHEQVNLRVLTVMWYASFTTS